MSKSIGVPMPKLSSATFSEFSAIRSATLEFCPGINVFIGENSTCKSMVMKLLYSSLKAFQPIGAAPQQTVLSKNRLKETLISAFRVRSLGAMIRKASTVDRSQIEIMAGSARWISMVIYQSGELLVSNHEWIPTSGSVFIPIECSESSPCSLVGRRSRIDTFVSLLKGGPLTNGIVLFWDDPEVNFGPKLIVKVARMLRQIASSGVQVFVATHSYLLTTRLSLAVEYGRHLNKSESELLPPLLRDELLPQAETRFFSFQRGSSDTVVSVKSGDTLADIEHNPILDEHVSQCDLEREMFRCLERIRTR